MLKRFLFSLSAATLMAVTLSPAAHADDAAIQAALEALDAQLKRKNKSHGTRQLAFP